MSYLNAAEHYFLAQQLALTLVLLTLAQHYCSCMSLQYAKLGNNSKSVLWPAPTAWGNVQLAALLPGYSSIDVTTRTNAMRILALYAMSYTQSLLPKDIPAADGSAPSIVFPYLTGMAQQLSACHDQSCNAAVYNIEMSELYAVGRVKHWVAVLSYLSSVGR